MKNSVLRANIFLIVGFFLSYGAFLFFGGNAKTSFEGNPFAIVAPILVVLGSVIIYVVILSRNKVSNNS